MITPLLRLAFDPVHQRQFEIRRMWLLGVSLLAAAIVSGILYLSGFALSWVILGSLGVLALTWAAGFPRFVPAEPDYTALARMIETAHPELHALLLTAVEQRPDPATGKLHLLQQKVIADAVAASRRLNWGAAAPTTRLWQARVFVACSGALLVLFLICSGAQTSWRTGSVAGEADARVAVSPGDTSVERGAGLIVLADFHRDAPGEATLIVQPKNQSAQRIPLVKNLDDPVFGGGLPEVDADLTYRIEYSGTATRDFSVKVFEHPRLDRADATLHFPAYTKLPDKSLPDTHRVSAVEGTKLDVSFQLNKPVKSASLVAKDGTTVPLTVAKDKAAATLRDFPVAASEKYELKLVDADGRANKIPAQFMVDALQHRAPELKFVTPKGDQRVSPIEEVAFHGQVWDDFGLARYGITVNVAGRGEREIELGRDAKADEKRDFAHVLKLEELGVKADELVSWFLWADDSGPDGKPRRTEGDMYFAEVRPFEEVYRQDDGGGGGGGGGSEEGSKAEGIANMQKQIISATWNLKRKEEANPGPEKPSAKYLTDEPVVRDSQQDALNQAEKLAAQIEDPKLHALAGNATHAMKAALNRLVEAASSPAPLAEALKDEQTAYDANLKLAEHEFRVKKSKGQGKGGGGKQKQQLDQLEMKDEKQNYETKKEAEPEQQQKEQREQLAILNRLKELAQRQQDVNERLKELQTALQAAKTEKEKEEVRRQLKRLREEEQQVLADIDETRQKMEESAQQSQLAEQRSQLDKTRAEAQKAAESMEKGETSQALASGTRTQRDLQQMRDEFRKKTSGQFNEEMRQMRTDARDLAQNQEDIAEKLKPAPAPAPGERKRRSLESSDDREKLGEKLAAQQAKLGKLTQKMQGVSEQAENVEPLLARELYDALRKTTQAGTGQTLEKTQELAQLGNDSDAQKFEEKARGEIENLKTGVERAAESVLGDEAEALRQARAELDKIKGELEREIAQARPDLAENGEQSAAQKSRAGDASKGGQPRGDQDAKKSGEGEQAGEGGKPGQEKSEGKETAQSGDEPGNQAGEKAGKGGPGKGQKPGQGEGEKSAGDDPSGDGKGKTAAQGQGKKEGQGQGQGQAQGQGRGQGEGQGQAPGNGDGATRRAEARSAKAEGSGEGGQTAGGNPSENAGGQRAGGGPRQLAGANQLGGNRNAGSEGGGGGAGGGFNGGYGGGPLTGERFAEWSDRLRNVEEMVDDPALRTEVARIREIAKGVRIEFKQHDVMPKWDMVKTKIGAPLAEIRDRLTEELARRESKESLVPIDRDPVPAQFAERVRRYYEELGRSH